MFRPTKNHAIGFVPTMLGLIVGITLGLSNLASAEFLFAEIPFDGISFDRLMGRDALPLQFERLPDLDFVAQTEAEQAGQQADIQAGAVELGETDPADRRPSVGGRSGAKLVRLVDASAARAAATGDGLSCLWAPDRDGGDQSGFGGRYVRNGCGTGATGFYALVGRAQNGSRPIETYRGGRV